MQVWQLTLYSAEMCTWYLCLSTTRVQFSIFILALETKVVLLKILHVTKVLWNRNIQHMNNYLRQKYLYLRPTGSICAWNTSTWNNSGVQSLWTVLDRGCAEGTEEAHEGTHILSICNVAFLDYLNKVWRFLFWIQLRLTITFPSNMSNMDETRFMCYINGLPDEILEFIFTLTSPYRDLKSMMLVCRRWHAVVTGQPSVLVNCFHCIF